ncbi:MAG: hypothetical protein IPK75_10735 [Acidobacteria bacterium]|nr:hypothetical protein [Acidobacteriota bacterium]
MKFAAVAAALLFAAACSGAPDVPAVPQAEIEAAAAQLVTYPLSLDPACRGGRQRAYDECSNQLDLFNAALDRANAEDKALLVVIGAEWCGWCRAFDAHLDGATGPYDRLNAKKRGDVSRAALELVTYTAGNYVIVHIEDEYAPGTDEVVAATEVGDNFQHYYPTIFSVTPDGKFAAKLDHPYVKIQLGAPQPYQGYDRARVLSELKRLRKAARAA